VAASGAFRQGTWPTARPLIPADNLST
jgi:hypothetical protein